MAGMRDIKRRIRSVKSTQQITKAMKMVSAAKLRKSQEKLLQYRPFSEAHHAMVGRVLSRNEDISHPLLTTREEGPMLFLFLTSDKGLCGGFNHGIMRLLEEKIKQLDREQVFLYPVGKKGRDYFRKRGYNIWKYLPMSSKEDLFSVSQQIGEEIITAYSKNEFRVIEIGYSFFRSALVQKPQLNPLIPLVPEPFEEEYPREYLFEPSAQKVVDILLPLSVKLKIYRSILETNTAEHGARMTAMDSATNNAVEMVASLTLTYNKARQAAITKELIEVVSGADALK
ncbi:ATP synthase F1 subunit gamma [candidate division CSSED10-310 bacterium]|uniref:ATP synthase gamma chain n=1 Tax=candidate division CSSED10-310 bacterium TaxID=2855610 RepID=A0ABV6YU67_UNCC1